MEKIQISRKHKLIWAASAVLLLAGLFVSAPVSAQRSAEPETPSTGGDIIAPTGFAAELIPPICRSGVFVRTCVVLQQACVRDSAQIQGVLRIAQQNRFIYFCGMEISTVPCPEPAVPGDAISYDISRIDGLEGRESLILNSDRCLMRSYLLNSGVSGNIENFCNRFEPGDGSWEYATVGTIAQSFPTILSTGQSVQYIYCTAVSVEPELVCIPSSGRAVVVRRNADGTLDRITDSTGSTEPVEDGSGTPVNAGEPSDGAQCLEQLGPPVAKCPLGYLLLTNYQSYSFGTDPATSQPVFGGTPGNPGDNICMPSLQRPTQCPDTAIEANFFVVRDRTTGLCHEARLLGTAAEDTSEDCRPAAEFRQVLNICVKIEVLPPAPAPCPGSLFTAESLETQQAVNSSFPDDVMAGDRLQPDELFLTAFGHPVTTSPDGVLQQEGASNAESLCARVFDFGIRNSMAGCDSGEDFVEVLLRREDIKVPDLHLTLENPARLALTATLNSESNLISASPGRGDSYSIFVCVTSTEPRQSGVGCGPDEVAISSDLEAVGRVSLDSCYELVNQPFVCGLEHTSEIQAGEPVCLDNGGNVNPAALMLFSCPATHPLTVDVSVSPPVLRESRVIGTRYSLLPFPAAGDRCAVQKSFTSCRISTLLSVDKNTCATEAEAGACNAPLPPGERTFSYLLIPSTTDADPNFCAKLAERTGADCVRGGFSTSSSFHKQIFNRCYRLGQESCDFTDTLLSVSAEGIGENTCYSRFRGRVGCQNLFTSYDPLADKCTPPGLRAVCRDGAIPVTNADGAEQCNPLRRSPSTPVDCDAGAGQEGFVDFSGILCGRRIPTPEGGEFECQEGQLTVTQDIDTRERLDRFNCYWPSLYRCSNVTFGSGFFYLERPFEYDAFPGASIEDQLEMLRASVAAMPDEERVYAPPQVRCAVVFTAQCLVLDRLEYPDVSGNPDYAQTPVCVNEDEDRKEIIPGSDCRAEEGALDPASLGDLEDNLVLLPADLMARLGIDDYASLRNAENAAGVDPITICLFNGIISTSDSAFTCNSGEILVDSDGRDVSLPASGRADKNGFPDTCLAAENPPSCRTADACDEYIERLTVSDCSPKLVLYAIQFYSNSGGNLCYEAGDSLGQQPGCSGRYAYLPVGSFQNALADNPDDSITDDSLLASLRLAVNDGICGRFANEATCREGIYFSANSAIPREAGCYETKVRDVGCELGFEIDPIDPTSCIGSGTETRSPSENPELIDINCPFSTGADSKNRLSLDLQKNTRLSNLLNRFLVNQDVDIDIGYEPNLVCTTVPAGTSSTAVSEPEEVVYRISSLKVDIAELRILCQPSSLATDPNSCPPVADSTSPDDRTERVLNPRILEAIQSNPDEVDGLDSWAPQDEQGRRISNQGLTTSDTTGDTTIDELYEALYGISDDTPGPWETLVTRPPASEDCVGFETRNNCTLTYAFVRPGWYSITVFVEWTENMSDVKTTLIPGTIIRIISVGELYSSSVN